MPHWSRVTDKVEPHGYYPSYLKLAAQIGPEGAVCEVGVAGGGSLEMWQNLFPFGLVAGVDNNQAMTWPEGTHRVISGQDDPGLPHFLTAVSPEGFDLIVDDCSHDGGLTQATWELLWPLVVPGGYYVVEDWNGAFHNSRQPDAPYTWGPGILATVQGFLNLLDSRESECDSIEYRYGLAILHRRT